MRTSQRIRLMADRYDAVTGGNIYQGREDGGRHYFADGMIYGDQAALSHMLGLCRAVGVPTDGQVSR